MLRLRALIRQQRMLAMMIVALALCVKVIVPTGYMVGSSSTMLLTVLICDDGTGSHKTATIAVEKESGPKEQSGGHGKADMPCPLPALSMASVGGADAPLLALALAFILALGFTPSSPAPLAARAYLRPPLRGPPLFA